MHYDISHTLDQLNEEAINASPEGFNRHTRSYGKKNVTEALQWKQWATLTVSAVYLILVTIRDIIIVTTIIWQHFDACYNSETQECVCVNWTSWIKLMSR